MFSKNATCLTKIPCKGSGSATGSKMAKLLKDNYEDHLKLMLIQFQESLKLIGSITVTWIAGCSSGQACVRKVANLFDQLEVCHKANLNLIPSKLPPDIKEKLQCKIQEALEEELIDLNEILKQLKENQNAIRSECYHAYKVYRERSKHLDISVQISGTASYPSILDLIEYFDTLQRFFVNEYIKRKIAVVKFSYDNKKSLCDLKECWTEYSLQKMGMTDLQPLVQIFLRENFTKH